jgi:hypothetical protein
LQVRPQVVPSQVAVPLGSPGHAVHEAPQVADEPLQRVEGEVYTIQALQVTLQLVPLQVAVPFGSLGHAVQEVGPQLAVLELLTQTPPHE